MIKLDKSLINTIEAFLLTAGRPLTVSEIRDLLNEKEESIELGKIRQTLGEIEERHRNTSLCLSEVASGFRLQVKDELSESLSLIIRILFCDLVFLVISLLNSTVLFL